MDVNVRHDEKNRRFVAEVDGRLSVIDYEERDDSTLDLRHTFVPEDQRHQGIASELARQAFDWAADHDYEVVATCPFVRSYVEDHPEVAGIVTGKSA